MGVKVLEHNNVMKFCPISCRNIPLDWVGGVACSSTGAQGHSCSNLTLEFLSAISEGG